MRAIISCGAVRANDGGEPASARDDARHVNADSPSSRWRRIASSRAMAGAGSA